MQRWQLTDFNYHLPQAQIARYPIAERGDSKLLVVEPPSQTFTDLQFRQIGNLLAPGDLVVLNNSKVIPARLRCQKLSGGQCQVMVERICDNGEVYAFLKANRPIKINQQLQLADQGAAEKLQLRVVAKEKELYKLIAENIDTQLPLTKSSWFALLQQYGEIPLPPYFKRKPEMLDNDRYQTVYATEMGSVAAPTAGLHFTEALIDNLQQSGIGIGYLTLHVGAGTFAPVRSSDILQHQMHAECFEISSTLAEQIATTKANGKRVIAVGTTTTRALEAAYYQGQLTTGYQSTDIFIYPGYQFQIIDGLITNFHLPQSTLLMLVSAFAGFELTKNAYQHAITSNYRFYSYGDAMFITKQGFITNLAN